METQPQAKLFRYTERLTSIALEEAAMTLIENDSTFSVLLSGTTRAGTKLSEIILEDVTLVRCRDKTWSQARFAEVSIRPNEAGIWTAEDPATKRLFHEPSIVLYHVIFLSAADYSRLMEHVKEDRLEDVFSFSQGLFGALPGFDFDKDGLAVPENYADAGRLIDDAEYLTEK